MRDIALCHPRLQTAAVQWLEACRKQGIIVKIGETLRTVEEQEALYAQGRTKPGPVVTNARGTSYTSQHQWGIAFDFYLQMDVDQDGRTGDDAYNDSTGLFKKAAKTAKGVGLAWGGDWSSIVDKPHLYLPDWGSTPDKLKRLYGTPEKFMTTWKLAKTGWIQTEYGWWYRHEDGSYTADNWEKIDGKWYWFNEDGYAYHSQWVQDKGEWYYLSEDNAMVTGLQVIDEKPYYFDKSGAMATETVVLTLAPNEKGELQST